MARLMMIRGPQPDEVFALDQDVISVGRGNRNHIVIRSNDISRTHCYFQREGDDYRVFDAGSTNGVFVNGHPVTESGWLLRQHSIIELGDAITFEYDTRTSTKQATDEAPLARSEYLIISYTRPPRQEIYPLQDSSITIGRSLECDIVLHEAGISREHFRLVHDTGRYVIEDLSSLNGTFVNQEELADARVLDHEDLIALGSGVTIRYMCEVEDVDTAMLDEARNRERAKADSGPATEHNARLMPPEDLRPTELEGHIMLVYDRDDWDNFVSRLYAYLKLRGVPVWAEQSLRPDTHAWQTATDQALSECSALVVVLTPNALRSEFVKRCIRYFVVREKPVFIYQARGIERVPIGLDRMPTVVHEPSRFTSSLRSLTGLLRKHQAFQDT
jgi:pSer/pThr/pTyr-binding forkhead associated (FHA) protein